MKQSAVDSFNANLQLACSEQCAGVRFRDGKKRYLTEKKGTDGIRTFTVSRSKEEKSLNTTKITAVAKEAFETIQRHPKEPRRGIQLLDLARSLRTYEKRLYQAKPWYMKVLYTLFGVFFIKEFKLRLLLRKVEKAADHYFKHLPKKFGSKTTEEIIRQTYFEVIDSRDVKVDKYEGGSILENTRHLRSVLKNFFVLKKKNKKDGIDKSTYNFGSIAQQIEKELKEFEELCKMEYAIRDDLCKEVLKQQQKGPFPWQQTMASPKINTVKLDEWGSELVKRTKKLKVGEQLTLPGIFRWVGKKHKWSKSSIWSAGHATIYKIKKTGKNTFTFTLINSGDGLSYHKKSWDPKKGKYQYHDYVIDEINGSELDKIFFQDLILKASISRGGGKKSLYGYLRQKFPFHPVKAGRPHDSQKHGCCHWMCLSLFLGERLGELGGKYGKQLFAEYKKFSTGFLIHELQKYLIKGHMPKARGTGPKVSYPLFGLIRWESNKARLAGIDLLRTIYDEASAMQIKNQVELVNVGT